MPDGLRSSGGKVGPENPNNGQGQGRNVPPARPLLVLICPRRLAYTDVASGSQASFTAQPRPSFRGAMPQLSITAVARPQRGRARTFTVHVLTVNSSWTGAGSHRNSRARIQEFGDADRGRSSRAKASANPVPDSFKMPSAPCQCLVVISQAQPLPLAAALIADSDFRCRRTPA